VNNDWIKSTCGHKDFPDTSRLCILLWKYVFRSISENDWTGVAEKCLLDNKRSLKNLIAAHLEPLTHSSSTILSAWAGGWKKERKNTHGNIPFNYSTTQMETVITWRRRSSPRRRRVPIRSQMAESRMLIGGRCWLRSTRIHMLAWGWGDFSCARRRVPRKPDGWISTQI